MLCVNTLVNVSADVRVGGKIKNAGKEFANANLNNVDIKWNRYFFLIKLVRYFQVSTAISKNASFNSTVKSHNNFNVKNC